jgi:hypothetical protein
VRRAGAALAWFAIRHLGAGTNEIISGNNSGRTQLLQKSSVDSVVCIDTTVAQEGPVPAHFFYSSRIDFSNQNLFAVSGSLGDHHAKRITQER